MRALGLLLALACVPARAGAQETVGIQTHAGLFDLDRYADPGRLTVDPPPAPAQPDLTAATYVPITARQRIVWIVDGTIGPKSLLLVGPLAAGWNTAFNSPEEWGRGWEGFGKRYLAREADVAISNTLEAGTGAMWGEEPRYIPSGRKGIWPRATYAMKVVFLTQRRDGRIAPAWGRYVGNTVNNLIENSYLPPSITTPGQTTLRVAYGFLGRLGGNLWEEFWPDARRLLFKRGKP